ncbi:MAG: hypothetical protein K1060chlam1_00294 [Candidatus Anoxychlamydiales bacterium]|nr:hypothetical protein [Candidatus Anoxychlamydiales bacterium]
MLLISVLPKLYAAKNNLNGLPNISTRTQSSWVVSADFLAWFPSEEVTSIWADVITIGDNTSSWEALGFNFKWDYGLRIGAGYGLVYDQWDTALYWTWFHTDAKHMIPFTSNASITPEFFAAFLSGNTPQSMNVKWSLLLNMFDWELGRSYWISKGVSLRPFLGVKGGQINQSIHAQYFNLTIDQVLTNNSGGERLKNNFWGIGPLGGINTKWRVRNFGSNFLDFFGDFSLATMWGTWINSDVYENTASQTSSVNMKNSTLGALMFRGFMGIEWNVDFQASKSHFATKLGYEMQIWLNQLRLATFQLQRLHGDLTLQGVTLNCRFDF